VVWVPEEPVPVMVIVDVPVGVVLEVEIVIVEVPLPLSDAGLNVADAPEGRPDADRFTVWLAPVSVTVIVDVVELPTVTVPELGEAEIEKSCVVEQPGSWKDASLVFQLKLPLAGMYSLVYQNVQSSDGSTCIEV
jgi:hypothetical protein